MLRTAFLVLLAGACATVSLPNRAAASPRLPIAFTLTSTAGADTVQLRLTRGGNLSHRASVSAVSLAPFDANRVAGSSTAVAFALVRQPGRLDCMGSGGKGVARGECRFSADRSFADFLARRGIDLPDEDAALRLVLAGATRELVQALELAHYPVPTLDQLTALAALQATPDYLASMTAIGHRPTDISTLISYKALGIGPAFIAELADAGYRNVSSSEIIQLRALGVSRDPVDSFAAGGGYRSTMGAAAAQRRMQERRR